MLRITGGELKGRKIKSPPGQDTRPTASRVRESLLAILSDRVPGARAADLFAGAGTMGFEAISRGAASCVFVERDPKTASVIKENVDILRLEERAWVLTGDAPKLGPRLKAKGPFDLVFADPPYRQGLVARTVLLVAQAGFLAPGGALVIEHAPQERPPEIEGLYRYDRRKYGQTEVSFLATLGS